MSSITVHETITIAGGTACDYLTGRTGLSKARIKDAMVKGAVWLSRGRGKEKRLRRATTELRKGDCISLYYDEKILSAVPPPARLVEDFGQYSVWWKPPGLLSQGTRQGDHCSLLRQVELFFSPRREVFAVHRLDREAAGLLLVAHGREAAGRFSSLFSGRRVEKKYRSQVVGLFAADAKEGCVDLPLDGKAARTRYTVIAEDPVSRTTLLEICIDTGRYHQIRRHLAAIGHPALGDPMYGEGNKNHDGLRLLAFSLAFTCPYSHSHKKITENNWPWPEVFGNSLQESSSSLYL